MSKNLKDFRELGTLGKVDYLVAIRDEEGQLAAAEFLSQLQTIEIARLYKDFPRFVSARDGQRNKVRGIISKAANLIREENEEDKGVNDEGKKASFVTVLVAEILYQADKLEPINSELSKKELDTEDLKYISSATSEYVIRTKRAAARVASFALFPVDVAVGSKVEHRIITVENGDGIHSFCWNETTQTLIYGFNAEPLDYIKMVRASEEEIAEVVKSILIN